MLPSMDRLASGRKYATAGPVPAVELTERVKQLPADWFKWRYRGMGYLTFMVPGILVCVFSSLLVFRSSRLFGVTSLGVFIAAGFSRARQ